MFLSINNNNMFLIVILHGLDGMYWFRCSICDLIVHCSTVLNIFLLNYFTFLIKGMKSNGISHYSSRNTYGFAVQDRCFPITNLTNAGLLHPTQFVPKMPPRPQLQTARRSSDIPQNTDSPTRKKFIPISTSKIQSISLSAVTDNRLGGQFLNKNEEKSQQLAPTDILRGSYSNGLRNFQQITSVVASLRKTTQFNHANKSSNNISDVKKTRNDGNSFNNFVCKTPTEGSNKAIFLKNNDKSKNGYLNGSTSFLTPVKLVDDKKLDQSANLSTTPSKNKSYDNITKGSGIKKNTAVGQEKKPFKSLNQIIQNRAKEKMALESSKIVRNKSKITNGFEISKTLGKGKFGEVFLSRHHDAGFIVALKKVIKKKVLQFKMIEQLGRQIRLHSCLDHPNIVKFYGCFEDQNDIYLVIEYMNGGTLFDYLNEINYLKPKEAVDYLRDIIDALVYMHQKSIAHRDIKPENIVINSEGVAKLCDFGWSAIVETSRRTFCGTFDYAPPEILEKKAYDTSVDVWCIGVLTYQLLTGRAPFEGKQKTVVMQKILNVDKQKIDYPVDIPAEAKQFIEALVQKDPSLRPKASDLLKFRLFSLYPRSNTKAKK